MIGYDSGRRYTVEQRNGAGKVITSTNYTDPEEALGNFVSHLISAGHDSRKVSHFKRVWTVTLMKGAGGYTVLDPGMDGDVSIRITTK